MQEHKND